MLPNKQWEPRASARAGLCTEDRELELFASGHLQYDFAVMLLDFHGGGLKPCEMCFCCCFVSLSSVKQLMATVCEETNVLHSVCWKRLSQPAMLLEAITGYFLFCVMAVSEAPSPSVRTEILL